MDSFLPTIILRHEKENKKKCSLKGLEKLQGFEFYSYPSKTYPCLKNYLILGFDGPILTKKDSSMGICVFDGTWKYAKKMFNIVPGHHYRTLPKEFVTAYPRRQTDCEDPTRGLSSLEAIYIAYRILNRNCNHLLDDYYWKKEFLKKNVQCFLSLS